MPGRLPGGRLTVLAALVLTGGAAAAQDYPTIRVGQTIESSLSPGDPVLTQRGRFKVFRFQAAAGQRYVISMNSQAFDPFVSVARLVAGVTDVIRSDDDGGEGTNARLRWTPDAAGTYLLLAQSYSSDGLGAFQLKLDLLPEPTTAAPEPIAVGQSISAALEETDASLEEDESFYDEYRLRARQGQRLSIEMRSGAFDSFLHFGRIDDGRWTSLRTDDDGLEGTDSRIRMTIAADGEYAIRANSVRAGETGAYTLQVTELPPPPVAIPQPLRVGATVTGELTDADATLDDDDVYYDLYEMQVRRGQRLQIDMQSTAFDAYLEIGRVRDGTWESLRTNDDGGDGTNARLRFAADQDGAYQVRARSFRMATGSYTLATQLLPPAPRPRPQAIRFGQPVEGRLTTSDALLEEEEIHYDLFTFRGRAGQRISADMRSADFDTYLDLGWMREGRWESLRTDDDGGEGTNSLLRYTLTADGEYMLRARSFGEGATGAYTLVVSERAVGQPGPPVPLQAGQEVHGALQDTDPELEDGSFYDAYAYAGQRGEEVTVELTSDDFDTYLQFGRVVNGVFEEIASDDDGGEGTNSRLVARLTETAEYVVRANSFGAGRTGAYRLRLTTNRDR